LAVTGYNMAIMIIGAAARPPDTRRAAVMPELISVGIAAGLARVLLISRTVRNAQQE
jgi:hypothetical protein